MSQPICVRVPRAGGASLSLQAVLGHGERGGAVVAPPHPLYGGELGNPVVVAIAQGLERAGIAPLCFNFRGVGESEGVPSERSELADADYRAALDALLAEHPGPCLAAGYSFGAAAATRVGARDERVAQILAVAPPLSMIDLPALRACTKPVTLLVGDDDAFAPLPALRRALSDLEQVALQVLPGVDHFFGGALAEVAAHAARVGAHSLGGAG